MNKELKYKGYFGSIEYSEPDKVYHGQLEFIRDLVTYESPDAMGLKSAFEMAVDYYLELCEAEGLEPNTPPKGSFKVRPGREFHSRAMDCASRRGVDLDMVVSDALRRYLDIDERVADHVASR